MQRLIWWLRRDFRLADNTALTEALADAASVIPVFILDEKLLNSLRTQGYRSGWLMEALQIFSTDLRKHGGRLIIRRGDPAEQLAKLCVEADAAGVYFNRDYSGYATKRDQVVQRQLTQQGLVVRDFKDLVMHEADEVKTGSGKQYKVYTRYRNTWSTLPQPAPLPTPNKLDRLKPPADLHSEPLPERDQFDAAPQPICVPGEAEALKRLDYFIDGLAHRYQTQRNLPSADGTSMLSPYLRWGMISPRTCYAAAQQAIHDTKNVTHRKNIDTWIGELIWREFNYQILATNPQIVTHAFRPVYDNIEWQNDPALFTCWTTGQTGFPIVDAAMRQLNTTGWMHNRMRMIVASFLIKDLLIDWRWGEHYFMNRLLDGDVANNVGNWQWVAGTGTDAAPYFRIFNPTSQSEKFDPTGAYIRQWIPELRSLPAKLIHQPARMSSQDQQRYGVQIGKDYPAPIVDHADQRLQALAMYKAVRSADINSPKSAK